MNNSPEEMRQHRESSWLSSHDLILYLFVFLGMLLIFVNASKRGTGCWTDCVHYVSTARNLAEGHGFFAYGDIPFVEFPPMLPIILAGFAVVSIDPINAANFLNILSYGAILFLAGQWLSTHLHTKTYVYLGLAAIVVSVPLVKSYIEVLAEPLFILFTLFFIIQLEKYLKDGKSVHFYGVVTAAALAFLTRYIGIAALMTAVLLIFAQRHKTLSERLRQIALISTICLVPMIIWLARNYQVSDTFTGGRQPPDYTLIENMEFGIDTATAWFLPSSSLLEIERLNSFPESIQSIVDAFALSSVIRATICVVLFIILLGALYRARPHILRIPENIQSSSFVVIISWIVIYTVILLILVSLTRVLHFPPVDNRYLAPIFIPIIFLLAFALDQISSAMTEQNSRRVWRWAVLIISGSSLVIYPFVYTAAYTLKYAQEGAPGYANNSWRNSELVIYLTDNAVTGLLYSNFADAVYIITNQPVYFTPRTDEDLQQLEAIVSSEVDGVYLAWFDAITNAGIMPMEVYSDRFQIEIVAQLSDGTLFHLTSR